jgi:hypothetical protein
MYNKEITPLTREVYLESDRKRKAALDPSERFEGLEFLQMPGQLSDREIKLRQQFVEEYVKDNDSYKALIRCGFIYAYADNFHKSMIAEPFVKDLIVAYRHKLETIEDIDKNFTEEIINVYRQVMNDKDAKPSERVSAASKLAELLALNKVQETKMSVELNGGIMKNPIYVGADGNVIDIDTFSNLAQKQQSDLRQKVLDSVNTEESD